MKRKFNLKYYQDLLIKLSYENRQRRRKPNTMQNTKRYNQMREMRNDGKTYSEIGQKFGISRQRVWEILKGDAE